MIRIPIFRKVVFLSVILVLISKIGLQAQPYIPVGSDILGTGYNTIVYAAGDTSGYLYFTGNFSGTLDYREKRIEARGKQNIFIGKLYPSGEPEYLHAIGGSGYCEVEGALFLPDGSGRLIIYYRDTIRYRDSVFVAPGRGNLAMILVDKAGEITGVRNLISGFSGRIFVVVRDTAGVIRLGGTFRKAVVNRKYYRSKGKRDGLLMTLKPDGILNFKILGGEGYEDIRLLHVSHGRLFMAGIFDRTLAAGDTLLKANHRRAAYLAVFTSGDKLTDARVLATAQDLSLASAIWQEGRYPYLAGWFRGRLSTTDTSAVSAGNLDGFILRADTGRADRVFTLGGRADDRITVLCSDTLHRLFFTADFKKHMIIGRDTLTAGDRYPDLVFSRFDPDLSILWTKQISGKNEENSTVLAIMQDQSVWIGGHFFDAFSLPDDENRQKIVREEGSYLLKYIDPCSLLHFDLPGEKMICSGSTDTLDAGSGYVKYLWTPGDIPEEKLPVHDTGFYKAVITDHYGCTASDSIHVTADSVRLAFDIKEETLPEGNNGAVDMTLLSGKPPFRILWNNGDVTEDLSGVQGGIYHVKVSDSLGCSVEKDVEVPVHDLTAVYDLYNYPNPFNDFTQIVYSLPEGTDIEISIYDLSGKKLFVLTEKSSQKGIHSFEWSRKYLKDGIYYLRLRSRFGQLSRKIIILKNH